MIPCVLQRQLLLLVLENVKMEQELLNLRVSLSVNVGSKRGKLVGEGSCSNPFLVDLNTIIPLLVKKKGQGTLNGVLLCT